MTARTRALGALRTPEVRQAATAALPPRPSPRTPRTPNDAGRCPTAPRPCSNPAPHAADLWLGTHRSLAVPGRRCAVAHSLFPQAPGAPGFRSAGRGAGVWGGAGEAPSCHGDARQAGEVRLDDNGRIEAELGLAPLPEWALLSVPLDEKERGARGRWAAVSRVSHTPRRSPLK